MSQAKNTINTNIIKVNPRAYNKSHGPNLVLADIHKLIAIKKKIPLKPN